MEINTEQVFTLSPDVLFQEVSGEMVLLDMASENYFGLDKIGARIWQFLSDKNSLGELIDNLESEYEVDRVTLKNDVADLLEALIEAGLIKA